jgi:hypothetical protein
MSLKDTTEAGKWSPLPRDGALSRVFGECVLHRAGDHEGEAGLAGAARPDQDDERDLVAEQQVPNRLDVVCATDERATGQREWSYGQGFAPGAG